MKAKKYWILVIVSFSILIVLWPTQQITGETNLSAKDKETGSNLTALQKSALSYKLISPDGKEILQGLEGVFVVVERIKPEVEKYGLTTQSLQTDTELQLRQYGIKVLTGEEWLYPVKTRGPCPWLYINVVVAVREETPIAAIAITVELRENVLLLREPPRICYGASIWRRYGVVSIGLRGIKDIREFVKDGVSEFINDYLAANPKETEEKSKNDN